MVKNKSTNEQNGINLIYIRAAIEAKTGVRLTLQEVRRYLIEEKLITKAQAKKYAQIFRGYNDFYEDCTRGYVPAPEEPVELTSLIPQ